MEVEIITPKISNKREDSFWYWGKEIARIKLENNHTLLMDVSGDVKYLERGNKYKNKDLFISGDISESNHFIIVELNESNKVVGDCLAVCHEYDEGIEMLRELAFIDEK